MPGSTPNYGLTKPLGSEFVDISGINAGDYDAIDTALHSQDTALQALSDRFSALEVGGDFAMFSRPITQVVPTNIGTAIIWTVETTDPTNMITVPSSSFAVKTTGYYQVNISLIAQTDQTNYIEYALQRISDGYTYLYESEPSETALIPNYPNVSQIVPLNANEPLRVLFTHHCTPGINVGGRVSLKRVA